MEVKSQFQYCPNFSNLTIHEAKVANYSNTISAAICLTLLLLLLGLLVLYKAYKTTLQRLFLQYTAAVAITNVVKVLNVELQFDVDKNFCSWLAFLEQWWVMTVQFLALSLVLYLSYQTYQKLRSRPLSPCFKNISKRCVIAMELQYTSLAVLLPLTYVWVPMKHHRYGLAQSLCWSTTYDRNCNIVEEGKRYVNVYGNIIFILQSIVTLLLLVLFLLFYIMILKYQQNRESRYNVCRASVVLVVLGISVMAKLSETITNLGYLGILNLSINTFYYDVIDDLIQTIAGTMLPLGFAVYLYSPNKLRPSSLKNAATVWLECKWTCAQYCCRSPRDNDDDFNTFESSVQYFTPSLATYSTPHTNEFINIAEITECPTMPQYGTIQQS